MNIGLKAALHYSGTQIFGISPQRLLNAHEALSHVRSRLFFPRPCCFQAGAPRWDGEDEADKEAAVADAALQPDGGRVPVGAGGADDRGGRGHQGQR